MKTNFLKTSLSAFAFALAIMASFAFSPAFNSSEVADEQGYIQTTDPLNPCEASILCENVPGNDCTVGIKNVFRLETQPTTSCAVQLAKRVVE